MKSIVCSIALLAFVAHSCVAAIVVKPPESELHSRVVKAAVDISTTCYGNSTNGIGVVGDFTDSILKTLWSTAALPATVVDAEMKVDKSQTVQNQYRLHVFIIAADSRKQFVSLIKGLLYSIWWNHCANFLIVNPTADRSHQCASIDEYLFIAFASFGVLNAQGICLDGAGNVSITNFNPFIRRAPKPWLFLRAYRMKPAFFNVFDRPYRQSGQSCEVLNFPKTMDLGGYPFYFISTDHNFNALLQDGRLDPTDNEVYNILVNSFLWFIENIVLDLNASAVISEDTSYTPVGIGINPFFLSDNLVMLEDRWTYPYFRDELLAITQHTGHMTQLDKILAVIDRPSRICMCIVYLITFLFFKFFLRQAVIPSILDLVRLTCGMGLLKLPSNLAPTIYLSCLLMFVVTLQGIYTGNLATLLTTNVHYPNVNKKQDIADLGYTIYSRFGKYFDDPIFDGRVVPVPKDSDVGCVDDVLGDPMVACVEAATTSMLDAYDHRLHLSRDPIDSDYKLYMLTKNNPFVRSLDAIFTKWIENGLRYGEFDQRTALLRAKMVNDDLVNKNVDRKVMDLDDLRFAFVILSIGLTCSLLCFIGEIVVYSVHLKIVTRRARAGKRVLVADRNRPIP